MELVIVIIIGYVIWKWRYRGRCASIVGHIFQSHSPERVGIKGEAKVSRKLLKLPPEDYYVFNNVLLKNQQMSSQIDHVVVSVYGVFVIETKNYSGWVTGGEASQEWTQHFYNNKYSFYNPIKQNQSHIKNICSTIKIHKDKVFSIIAFSDDATLKVNTTTPVCCFSQLTSVIKSYQVPIFTKAEVDKIQNALLYRNISDQEEKHMHAYNTQNKVHQTQSLIHQGICPWCNNKLVERTGKYGNFIGCMGYPKCKFKSKID